MRKCSWCIGDIEPHEDPVPYWKFLHHRHCWQEFINFCKSQQQRGYAVLAEEKNLDELIAEMRGRHDQKR